MKAVKIVALVVGALLVLLVIGLALAFTPSVQTWAVRKAFADQPGTKLEVDRVAAGMSSANISNLRFAQEGMVVTAKGVSARYSAWDFLTKDRVDADSVVIEDLVIDLRQTGSPTETRPSSPGTTQPQGEARPSQGKATPSVTAEKQPPFEGILKQAQLPFDVRVASITAKGRALLPANQTVTFELTGAGIQTGQRGKLDWVIEFADGTNDAALRSLRTTGNAGVHIASDRRIDLIEIDAIATATGPKLPPDRVQLIARAEQPVAGGNEGYTARVALLRGNDTETLFKTNAQFVAAAREIAGAWEISLRSEQLAAMLTGLGLPEIAANGSGKFNLKPDTQAVSASGDLQGEASQLAKLNPALAAVGAVHFRTIFDGALAGDAAQLEKLQLEITGLDGRRYAQISSLQKVSYNLENKRVTLADPRAEVARVALQDLPLAWAQPIAKPLSIDSGSLSITLAVEAEPDGSRIRARATDPLALREVTVRDAEKKPLIEKLTLTARPSVDYSATRIAGELAELNISLPGGDALSGNISADVADFANQPVIAFATKLQGKLVALHKPHLPFDPGPLAIASETEGRHTGTTLQLAKATSVVNRDSGALLAATELLQPLQVNLEKTSVTATDPKAAAARVRLGEIPLAWAEGFVADSKFAGAVSGATLEVILRSLDDLTVNTTQPIALRGVSATLEGKPMVQALDLAADLTATKRGETIAYDLRRVDVKQGEAQLATLAATGEARLGEKLSLVAKGKLDANAAALMNQPVAASFASLQRGNVSTDFDLTYADAIQAKATLAARGLVAKQNNQPLGDLEARLEATVKADGSGVIRAPVTLVNGNRRSNVSVDGTFGKSKDQQAFVFSGKIASEQLFVDDFMPLAAVAPASEPAAPANRQPVAAQRPVQQRPVAQRPAEPTAAPSGGAATPTPAATETSPAKPFWSGVLGKVELDLERVIYGRDYPITGIRGAAMITENRLALDTLEGRLKETPFKASGAVAFNPAQPKPYTLTATTDVRDFDVGEFLRAANPQERPAIDTKATVLANLNANGVTPGELAKNIYGKFELSAADGVTPILANKGNLGRAIGLAAGVAQIIGQQKQDEKTLAFSRLAQLLNEVRFDSFKMQIERGADLNMKISLLEIVSPILHAVGSGTVANQGDAPVTKQPMNLLLQLGAKGEFAFLLDKLGVQLPEAGPLGYHQLQRTFQLGGTASNPDSTAFWRYLLDLGAQQLGAPGGIGDLLRGAIGR